MSGPVRKECINFVIAEKKEEFRLDKKIRRDDEEQKEKEVVVPPLGYINMLVSFKDCFLVQVE